MFINPNDNSSPIDIVLCHNHFTHTLNGKTVKSSEAGVNASLDFSDSKNINSDLKNQLIHRQQFDILQTMVNQKYNDVVFMNSEYEKLFKTFTEVTFTVTKKDE